MMTRNKVTGNFGEDCAVKYLKKKKLKIVERNHREGKYEIDVIASDKATLVFAEVKTRRIESGEEIAFDICAASAVDNEKQRRTVLAAKAYLAQNPTQKSIRFDVVEVYLDKINEKKLIEINHIENAF